jgi:hypothetical protein
MEREQQAVLNTKKKSWERIEGDDDRWKHESRKL